MCIAILKTKKGVITDEELRESFNSNRDGAGIAYTVKNKLYILKGIFKVEDFIKSVRAIEKVCDNNMLIHCRIGTSGNKDKENTHPFFVNKNVALIHNGILNIDVPKDSNINDTQIFIEKYLKDIGTKDLLHSKALHNLIAEAIGKNNKFVLMDNTGYYKIINEKQGHWKDNVWFSNSSYKAVTRFWNYYGHDYDDVDWETRWYNAYKDSQNNKEYIQGKLIDSTSVTDRENDYKTFESYGLTNNDYYAIEEQISNLTLNDFARFDCYPVLDLTTKKLTTYEEASAFNTDENYAFLQDVSEDLYDYYIECYETAEDLLYEDTTQQEVA